MQTLLAACEWIVLMDGPLVFMEVDPGFRDFTERDVVILKVKHEDFIPRK